MMPIEYVYVHFVYVTPIGLINRFNTINEVK